MWLKVTTNRDKADIGHLGININVNDFAIIASIQACSVGTAARQRKSCWNCSCSTFRPAVTMMREALTRPIMNHKQD